MQTVVKGTTSQAFDVDVGQTVTVTPGSGGSMLVEYTTDGEVAIRNNSATWQAWTAGTVSSATSDVCMFPLYARVTAYTASGSYAVTGSGLQDTRSTDVVWKRDVGSPRNADYAAAVVGAAYGQQKNVLKFCIPGLNASVEFSDVSGNAATATIDAGNTGAFATPGYMATIAATNGGISIAGASLPINFATDSFVYSFVMKMAAPGANNNLLAVHANVGAGGTGFYLSHRTSGALKIVPTVAGTIVNAQADSTLVFSDGTPQDRHCTVVYDAPTGVFSIYRDGVLSNSFTGTPMTGANAFPDAVQTTGFRIGGTAGGPTIVTVASLTYAPQLYVWEGSLPANIGQVASILANSPRNPLPLGVLNV